MHRGYHFPSRAEQTPWASCRLCPRQLSAWEPGSQKSLRELRGGNRGRWRGAPPAAAPHAPITPGPSAPLVPTAGLRWDGGDTRRTRCHQKKLSEPRGGRAGPQQLVSGIRSSRRDGVDRIAGEWPRGTARLCRPPPRIDVQSRRRLVGCRRWEPSPASTPQPSCSLGIAGHLLPQTSPRACRQSWEQNKVVARSQVVTTKNSTMEFSSKEKKKEK